MEGFLSLSGFFWSKGQEFLNNSSLVPVKSLALHLQAITFIKPDTMYAANIGISNP
jgi:hypothetical protein